MARKICHTHKRPKAGTRPWTNTRKSTKGD